MSNDLREERLVWLQPWLSDILEERYGEEIGSFLVTRLTNELWKGEFENADHFRVCDISIPEEMESFELNRGCCGTHEIQVTHPGTGRMFWLGFNYGH